MSIFENQTFRKKLTYIHNTDNEKEVHINFSITTNHDIDKSVLLDIEKNIEAMFLNSYQNASVLKKAELELKEYNKLQKQYEKDKLNEIRQKNKTQRQDEKDAKRERAHKFT